MRIFKSKGFNRWAEKNQITDKTLCTLVEEIQTGNFDANLGGGLYKQRLARKGQGSSGGFRVIIVFKIEKRAFFVFGFAKNEKENLSQEEKKVYKKLAVKLLSMSDEEIRNTLKEKIFLEIPYHDKKKNKL